MDKKNQTEEELSLTALQAGDSVEFARLVDAYSAQIYRLALKMLADPNDAEDVLQETFIKAYRSLPSFEGRSSLLTWLYRIATNESLMVLRKRKPQQELLESDRQGDEDEEAEELQIVDWCCMPERELLSSESRRFLDQAMEKLSPALKVVFLLRDVQGLSIKETAEVLEVSEAAVKTRLLRARLQLRDELSSYFGERMAEKQKK